MDLRAGGYDTISIVGGCAGIGTTTPGEKLEVIENYENPPFNTIKKKDTRKVGTENDFLNHLYGI